MNFFEFVRDHFWHAAPIIIAGIFGLAIGFERAIALFKNYPVSNPQMFFSRLSDKVSKNEIKEALVICDELQGKPLVQIAKTALRRADLPEDAIDQGITLTLSENIAHVQKYTPFLATIANVATLLGLLGTVAGLIQAFDAVAHADAQQKSALLSAGIATSMTATMLGLAVAIPAMVAYAILISRTNKMISELEDGALRMSDMLKSRSYAAFKDDQEAA